MEDNNLNLMSLYLSDIQKFDLLSKEEEYELLKRIGKMMMSRQGNY